MANEVDYRDPTPNNFPQDYDPAKVDPRVKLRSESIKHKQKGKHTREAMYQALEISSVDSSEAKSVAESLNQRVDDQIAAGTIKDEEIDFRHSDMLSKTFDTMRLRGNFFDEELASRGINVKWFGAVGDGTTDDTAAIQSAIDAMPTGATLLFEGGTYLVQAEEDVRLKLKSEINIKVAESAIIKVKPNANTHYYLFDLTGISNVNFSGNGLLLGDNADHTGTTGEWGHAFEIADSKNIKISDLTITEFWGDGIELAGWDFATRPQNIELNNLTIKNCRRQGISFCNADGVRVNNVTIDGIKGTAPEAGIDFEPFNKGQTLNDITINGARISNCATAGILFAPADISQDANNGCEFNITINDAIITDSKTGIELYHELKDTTINRIGGHITINNALIKDVLNNGVGVIDWADSLPSVNFYNLQIIDHGQNPNLEPWNAQLAGIYLHTLNDKLPLSQSAQINFYQPTIKHHSGASTRGIWVQSMGEFVYNTNIIDYDTNFAWNNKIYVAKHRGKVTYTDPTINQTGDFDQGLGNAIKGMTIVYSNLPSFVPSVTLPKIHSISGLDLTIKFMPASTDTTNCGYIKKSDEDSLIFYNKDNTPVFNTTNVVDVVGRGAEVHIDVVGERYVMTGFGLFTQ